MPHRLRQVIGVNLYAPKLRGTSQRFAVLDTRGSVAVSGSNGVGKTSFLRLLPLFYGAVQNQILRNSGHETMLRHTLPEPTSAVVFEYERETEHDVRCTVMFCQKHLDAPEFHLVKGAFNEQWFLGPDSRFLNREEFKARAEHLGCRVEPLLDSSNYRAVILGERAHNQSMVRMRQLSKEYSLAPGSLSGLDLIAAAMGPETLSFRTLRSIVVSRAASDLDSIELKKDLKNVVEWLATHDHLSKVQARASDASQLRTHCRSIDRLDQTMRTLRADARALARRVADETVRTTGELAERSQAWLVDKEKLEAGLVNAQGDVCTAEEAHAAQKRVVLDIVRARDHFAEINAADLAIRAAEKPSLGELQRSLERQLHLLNTSSTQITEGFLQAKEPLDGELTTTEKRIREDGQRAQDEQRDRIEAINERERQQAQQTGEPPELIAARGKVGALTLQLTRLETERKNPAAPPELLTALQATRQRLLPARSAARDAAKLLPPAHAGVREAEQRRDVQMRDLEAAERALAVARQDLAAVDAKLTPQKGSLLEYLRATNLPDLQSLAKVLHPQLLDRTDLTPHDGSAPGGPDFMSVGSLTMNVRDVPADEWLDAPQLQRERALAVQKMEFASRQLVDVQAKLRTAQERVDTLSGQLVVKQAEAESRAEAVTLLEADEQRHIQAVQAAVAERTAGLDAQLEQTRADHEGATNRQSEASITWAAARARLAQDFKAQRDAVESETTEHLGELKRQLKAAVDAHTAAVAHLAKQRDGKLAAAGINPAELADLKKRYEHAGEKLLAIAEAAPQVKAWLKFRDEVLPGLATEHGRLENLDADLNLRKAAVVSAQQRLNEATGAHSRATEALNGRLDTLKVDADQLAGLLARELRAFPDTVAEPPDVAWSPLVLAAEVADKAALLQTELTVTTTLAQAIRGTMTATSGPASDWLLAREAQEPDLALEHHMRVSRAGKLLVEWYDSGYADALHRHNTAFHGTCGYVLEFVRLLETFERGITAVGNDLRGELSKIRRFPGFEDLNVAIKSGVGDLTYLDDLRRMADRATHRTARSRDSDAREGRMTDLPPREDVELMRKLRDILKDGTVRASVADLIKLQCELTIDGKRLTISREEEFKLHASTGNTGMIVSAFLMGFAGMLRRDARAPVRMTWISDEFARFDAGNLFAFLRTLDENNIDVISAAPMTNAASLDMFDSAAVFRQNGSILSVETEAPDPSDTQEAAHATA